MKLIDWMRREGVDDKTMAHRVGDCTESAVRKWKYGERTPPPERIVLIEQVTSGAVTLRDFVGGEQAAPAA